MLQVAADVPASKESESRFPSARHLSSSGSYPLDLSGLGDAASSSAATDLDLRVIGNDKPLHNGKVKIPAARKM